MSKDELIDIILRQQEIIELREMLERVLAQRILEGSGSGNGRALAGSIRQPPCALSALSRMEIRAITSLSGTPRPAPRCA